MRRRAAVVDSSLDGVATVDGDGLVLEWNLAAERMFGLARDEALGRGLARLILPPRLRGSYRRWLGRYVAGAGEGGRRLGRRIELAALRHDGEEFPCELTVSALRLENKPAFTVSLRDISERKQAEADGRFLAGASAALASSLDFGVTLGQLSELVVPHLGDWCLVHICEEDGSLRPLAQTHRDPGKLECLHELAELQRRFPSDSFGPALVQRTRQPELVGEVSNARRAAFAHSARELQLVEALGLVSRMVVPLVARGRALGTITLCLSGGGRRYGPADLALAEDLAGRAALAVDNARLYREAQDEIERRKRAEEQLAHLAFHDALTGLPNRVLLVDRLELATAMARREGRLAALIMVDLDRFKVVNDTLGHEAGDGLLREVAARLRACLREVDTVARMGGDEFTIVLPGLEKPADAAVVAEKVLAALGGAFVVAGHELFVTASLGVALYPQDGPDASALQRSADTAMYQAKRAGKNRYQLSTPEIAGAALERLALENALHRALERGELRAHYQPKVELASWRVEACEALARWNHPELGLLEPAHFMPLAEESGLVVGIGAWMLGEACRQNAAWQRAGLAPFKVAVNVSALQFGRADLVDTVTRALEESGLEPRWLELELVESLVMRDVQESASQLAGLKALGVRLSVDDFGTGYSSLSYLQLLPIDTLKIDRSFVGDIGGGRNAEPLIEAIIGMSHSLGLSVVAEGVETDAQLALLRDLDCDKVQGYLFARPMPADEAAGFLARFEALSRARQEGGG